MYENGDVLGVMHVFQAEHVSCRLKTKLGEAALHSLVLRISCRAIMGKQFH